MSLVVNCHCFHFFHNSVKTILQAWRYHHRSDHDYCFFTWPLRYSFSPGWPRGLSLSVSVAHYRKMAFTFDGVNDFRRHNCCASQQASQPANQQPNSQPANQPTSLSASQPSLGPPQPIVAIGIITTSEGWPLNICTSSTVSVVLLVASLGRESWQSSQ